MTAGPGELPEPYRSEFVARIRAGAAAVDIAGMSVTGAVSDAFVERELDRPRDHTRNIGTYLPTRPPLRILDAGCGTGGLSVVLASRFPGAAVCGFDSELASVEAARVRAAGYGRPIRFDLVPPDRPLPYADRTFDLVTCTSVLEFITALRARERFAAELVRVCSGKIVVTTPNPCLRVRELHSRAWFGDVRRRPDTPWASTPAELRRMFAPLRACPVPARVRDKLGLHWLPPGFARPLERLMPWQFCLFVREAERPVGHSAREMTR